MRLLAESSVGAGLRRIDALTGIDALRHADQERRILAEVGRLLGAQPNTVAAQLTARLTALAKVTSAELRTHVAEVLARGPSSQPGVAVLGCISDGKAQLVATINDRLAEVVRVEAVDLLREANTLIGGGAGGTGLVATAGGRKTDRLRDAVEDARHAAEFLTDAATNADPPAGTSG